MSRAASVQADPPASLNGFPDCCLVAHATLYRAVGTSPGGNPWGFGKFTADGDGRFNLASPRGTIYVATTKRGAALEALGTRYASKPSTAGIPIVGTLGIVGTSAVWKHESDLIFIWSLRLEAKLDSIADLHHTDAANFDVTAELTAGGGDDLYDLTKRWANAFDRQAFTGIRYRTRFDTSDENWGYAIFGDEGIHRGPFTSIAVAERLTVIAHELGIRVLDRTSAAAVPTNIVPMPGSRP